MREHYSYSFEGQNELLQFLKARKGPESPPILSNLHLSIHFKP